METAVLRTTPKNVNVNVHLDIYEPIWFKLGMVIDSAILYILILVPVKLTLLKVTGMQESKNLCASYLPKL